MQSISKRDFGYDNIKFILILFVIVGHLLEFCKVDGHGELYNLIYLFHMPVFLFLTGLFSGKKSSGKVFPEFLTYIVFQTLYIAFANGVLGIPTPYQYTTPHWILWYLLALVFYRVLTPLYDTKRVDKAVMALAVTILLSLLVGHDNSVGYYASLSRFFVFQPYYLLGFYFKKAEPTIRRFLCENRNRRVFLGVISIAAASITLFLAFSKKIRPAMLYGASSYSKLDYSILVRASLLLAGIAWISFFIFVLKPLLERRIFLVSEIGAHTLPVFLFHGFAVRLLQKYHLAWFDTYWFVFGASAVILLAFGNPIFSAVLRFGFPKKSKTAEKTEAFQEPAR